jgi:hypothetical protein
VAKETDGFWEVPVWRFPAKYLNFCVFLDWLKVCETFVFRKLCYSLFFLTKNVAASSSFFYNQPSFINFPKCLQESE